MFGCIKLPPLKWENFAIRFYTLKQTPTSLIATFYDEWCFNGTMGKLWKY